jgi:hypothetical protein
MKVRWLWLALLSIALAVAGVGLCLGISQLLGSSTKRAESEAVRPSASQSMQYPEAALFMRLESTDVVYGGRPLKGT